MPVCGSFFALNACPARLITLAVRRGGKGREAKGEKSNKKPCMSLVCMEICVVIRKQRSSLVVNLFLQLQTTLSLVCEKIVGVSDLRD